MKIGMTHVDSNGRCPECGELHPDFAEVGAEYWHMDPEGEGMAGPFATEAEAKADAEKYLHDASWKVRAVKIVKTVASSQTKVSYSTDWVQ